MGYYKSELFHDANSFTREAFEKRMSEYGFKNIKRIELFLWDLELFLQIQDIFHDRIALKGGAATQFYLPIEAQRTSVDIDMIFNGTKPEIDEALRFISNKMVRGSHFFIFQEHLPKEPKTTLPLYTYHVKVPSVLETKELWNDNDVQEQELKIEFILQDNLEKDKVKGTDIFAVQSDLEYNVLPINSLFADKLTTLGPNSIGVQDYRLDEQIKQFYDIWMLAKYHFDEFDAKTILNMYLTRAEQECRYRGKQYDLNGIKSDVYKQLYRFSSVDSGEDAELKRGIDNFKSLYLNSKVEFNTFEVVCAASMIKLLYEEILNNGSWYIIKQATVIVNMLRLECLSGLEKGSKTAELREMLIREFSVYSSIPVKILKGKSLIRIFWAIVNADNIKSIKVYIEELL